MTNLGMVILNYNDFDNTSNILKNIKDYSSIDKIIIVDNNSADDSYDKLKKFECDKIDVVKSDKNGGYAYGNNWGIKYLVKNYRPKYILISNPDIEFKNEDIVDMLGVLDKNKNIAIVAPRVNEHGTISRGWKLPRFIDELLSNINYVQRYAKKLTLYKDEHYKAHISYVDVVSGCFFLVKAGLFKKIDYFDEGTFLFYEENIIGKKLKDIGFKECIDNNVEIKHNVSQSIDKSIKKINKYKILKQSQRYYERKYNHLNIFGMGLLWITYYISLGVSYIIYLFQKH